MSGRSPAGGMSAKRRFCWIPDVQIGIHAQAKRDRVRTLLELDEEGGVVPRARRDLNRIAKARFQLAFGVGLSQNDTVPFQLAVSYGMFRCTLKNTTGTISSS